MLYIIVIAVILVIVIAIYLVRSIQQKRHLHKMNNLTPICNPDDYRETEPVTFRGTANEVTERFFGRRPGETDLERGNNDPFSPGWADRYGRTGTGGGVHRAAEDGEPDMDLPRYGDNRGTTAVKAPERAYNPSAPPRLNHVETQSATNDASRDAPPQYDRAISTPAITGPPVVTTL